MENNPDTPQQPHPLSGNGGEKVIQPLVQPVPDQSQQSPSNAEPMQPVPTLAAVPVAGTPAPVATNTPATPAVPHPDASSIYPTATKGIGISDHAVETADPVPSTEPSTVDSNIAGKIVLVRVITGILLLLDGINLIDSLLLATHGSVNIIGFIEIVLITILLVGIFQLKESARVTYVYLTILLLCVSAVTIFVLDIQHPKAVIHSYTESQPTESVQQQKQSLERAIQNSYKNKNMTPAQRQQYDNAIQKEINSLPSSDTTLKLKQYISEALIVILAFFPLIFYTRPSIKSVFE